MGPMVTTFGRTVIIKDERIIFGVKKILNIVESNGS
jgi:hypothetical protein